MRKVLSVSIFLSVIFFNVNLFAQPDCTVPVKPGISVTNVSIADTLIWEAVAGATGYKLWFGTDGGGTTDPTDIQNGLDVGADTFYVYAGAPLQYATSYYWKVVPYDGTGDAVGCAIWTFATEMEPAPLCSTPVEPLDLATNVAREGFLTWNSVDGATGYKVWFGSDGAGIADPTNLLDGVVINDTTYDYSITPLDYLTIYYWKVVPFNNSGDAIGCDIWSFTTVAPPPPPNCTTLISPADLATGVTLTDMLIWNSSEDATGYKIWFGSDGGGVTDPTNIENGTAISDTTYDLSSAALQYSTTYYWKIAPYNDGGDAAGCEIWEFTTMENPNPPDCSTPLQPVDGAVDVSRADTLKWAAVDRAVGYKIWFGSDGDGTTDPTDIANGVDRLDTLFFSYSADTLDYYTSYYWKIVPYNNNGDAIGCDIWSFKTVPNPAWPDCTTPVQPADSATNVSIADSLVWNSVDGATGYKLWFGYDGNGATDPTNIEDGTDLGADTTYNYATLKNLLYGIKYFWKVVPYNAEGDAAGCDIWEFTTEGDPHPPGCSNIVAPEVGEDSVSVDGTLSWEPSFGSTGFKIWFYTDGGGFADPDTIEFGADIGYVFSYNYTGLQRGQTYTWKIVPYNSNGDATGCVNWYFTTLPEDAPPLCTTFVSPVDSAQNVIESGYLRWNKSVGAKGYIIWFGSNGGGVSNPTNVADSVDLGNVQQYAFQHINYSTKYYWKISPYNEAGNALGCDIWEFTVRDNPNPPPCSTPITPPDSSIKVTRLGTLKWTVTERTDGYKVYFGSDGGGVDRPTNILDGLDVGNINTYGYSSDSLDYGTTYYWQIVPYNGNGESVNCPIWRFQTKDRILISSPDQGDEWVVGSVEDITWYIDSGDTPGDITINHVKLSYSVDDGNIWTFIATNIPVGQQRYSWVIPNHVSDNCRIKITDVDDGQNYGISWKFKIKVIDFISVVFPNGGEHLGIGDDVDITWNSSGVDLVKIEYTPAGNNWTLIADSVNAADGSYHWVVPNVPSTTAKIRLTSVENNAVSDESNSVFWITPYVEFIKPAEGDTLTGYSYYDIQWESGGVNSILIRFSSDGGNVWQQITSGTPADNGVYAWQVPNRSLDSCMLYAQHPDDDTIFDYSEMFSIRPDTVSAFFEESEPDKYKLYQNFPNPFNPSTEIRYTIPEGSFVSLKIFNILGEEVVSLVDAYQTAGSYRKIFDASKLNSGIYIYKLQTDKFTDVKKMLLLK